MEKVEKNKLIVVVYAGCKGLSYSDVADFLRGIEEVLGRKNEQEIMHYIIPVFSTSDTKVDCINPVLLTQERYTEVSEKVAKLEAELKNSLKEWTKN